MTSCEKLLLAEFRSLIRESAELTFHIDGLSDELLLCFMRARKHDLMRAHRLLKNYLKMARCHPELMGGYGQSVVQRVLDLRYHLMSPRREGKNGSRVFLVKAGHWDIADSTLEEVFCTLTYCFQMMASEEDTQRKGIVIVMDFEDVHLNQIRHLTTDFMKKLANLVNDVFPLRFNGIHVVYEPWVFKIILSMIWPFLSVKIRNRVFFHGYSVASLHKHVDPACLPSNYGGRLEPIDKMHFSKVLSEKNRINIFQGIN